MAHIGWGTTTRARNLKATIRRATTAGRSMSRRRILDGPVSPQASRALSKEANKLGEIYQEPNNRTSPRSLTLLKGQR
jgi:hypothetical protein